MKNRIGKITVILLIAIMLFAAIVTVTSREAKAATATQLWTLPSNSIVTHSATTYVVVWERTSGDLVTAADGTTSSAVTWANAALEDPTYINVHAQNGLVYRVLIPPLNQSLKYALAIFDAATPAKADVPTMGPFIYDPVNNQIYTDTNPTDGAKVRVTF